MKKIVSTLMATIMVFSGFSFTLASAASPQSSSDDEFYMVRGQIDLAPIANDLYVENGKVKVSGKETMASKRLVDELEISPNLND